MLYHLTEVGYGKHSQNRIAQKLKFNKNKDIPKKDKQHSGGERNRGGQAFGKIATCFQKQKIKCKLYVTLVGSMILMSIRMIIMNCYKMRLRPTASVAPVCQTSGVSPNHLS